MDKAKLDTLRNFIGKVNRIFSQQDRAAFYQAVPVKTDAPEVQDPPPQITGVRNQRNNAIPGNKASKDRISGSFEAGGRSASGF